MPRIPDNNDPFYPLAYHIDDHTPDVEEDPVPLEDWCDGCERPGKYCICP